MPARRDEPSDRPKGDLDEHLRIVSLFPRPYLFGSSFETGPALRRGRTRRVTKYAHIGPIYSAALLKQELPNNFFRVLSTFSPSDLSFEQKSKKEKRAPQ